MGKMTDDLGPGIPVLIGTFLHVFGLMMTSLSKEYYQIFLAQSICSAMGCSFLFNARKSCQVLVSLYMLTANSYRRPRDVVPQAPGFRVRYCYGWVSLGGVVLPIMVNYLVVSVGFAWAMRSTAFLFLGLLVIGNLTVKSRLPPTKRPFRFKAFIVPSILRAPFSASHYWHIHDLYWRLLAFQFHHCAGKGNRYVRRSGRLHGIHYQRFIVRASSKVE